MSDEANALARLRQRIHQVGAEHGLEQAVLFIAPAESEDGTTQAHVFFVLSDEAPPSTDDETKAAFEEVIDSAAAAERQQPAPEARENLEKLKERLEKGDGIL